MDGRTENKMAIDQVDDDGNSPTVADEKPKLEEKQHVDINHNISAAWVFRCMCREQVNDNDTNSMMLQHPEPPRSSY